MSKARAERKIYGINACQSFFQRFPDRIIRAWITEDAAKTTFGPLMKLLAQEKRAYHLADADELERVTDSSHHEGVCLLVEELPVFTPETWLATLPAGKPVCALALDGVANPHNLGAIMRVAAHFGVSAIITQNPQALRSGAAVRTAEGGATHVMVVGCDHLVKTLHLLKKNTFTVLATSSHENRALYGADALPSRLVLVLGEEQNGVSKAALQAADGRIGIPGSGWVESLNVSVATGVLLGEFWRQHRARRQNPKDTVERTSDQQHGSEQESAAAPRSERPQVARQRTHDDSAPPRRPGKPKPAGGFKPKSKTGHGNAGRGSADFKTGSGKTGSGKTVNGKPGGKSSQGRKAGKAGNAAQGGKKAPRG